MRLLPSGAKTPNRILAWLAANPCWVLTLMTLVTLSLFVTKPFNIDDPLFIWVARNIQAQPGRPYDFSVNWYGRAQPMWETTKNPPLACYYLAVGATILGWSESALHAVFVLPVLAAILGTYRLAKRFCSRPVLAASITLFTPVFLVSSTTLMCDVLMLAFWVWAIVLWLEGTDHNDPLRLSGAALLIGMAALTKYYGICLLPLLAAWSLLGKHRIKNWVGYFIIPVGILAVYLITMQALYGHGLLSDAGNYAVGFRKSVNPAQAQAVLTALAFTGGCLAVSVFFTPILWRPATLAMGMAISVLVTALLCVGTPVAKQFASSDATSPNAVAMQLVFWGAGGISVLALAAADVCKRRDADSSLLGLWLGGTFVFTALFNWTINGRSILPMAVPTGIFIARRLDQRAGEGVKITRAMIIAPLATGAVLALLVARSDFLLAWAVRQTAQEAQARYGHGNHTFWFQGHHGFQYYMEAAGASALDFDNSVQSGDYVAIPLNNPNTYPVDETLVTQQKSILVPGPNWLTTMNMSVGAGFYTSLCGPLPFAFGRVPPEQVLVYLVNLPLSASGTNSTGTAK
ncbi:MAG: glycosyltransferase family 39 protein [Verrucomicrobiota bacterium]